MSRLLNRFQNRKKYCIITWYNGQDVSTAAVNNSYALTFAQTNFLKRVSTPRCSHYRSGQLAIGPLSHACRNNPKLISSLYLKLAFETAQRLENGKRPGDTCYQDKQKIPHQSLNWIRKSLAVLLKHLQVPLKSCIKNSKKKKSQPAE